ncbi:hypothetical protein TNCV_4521031 [Trichonephila clavipes]|nr:hypothetical protein TNCV_4521031 [Trichonephila clavipes]
MADFQWHQDSNPRTSATAAPNALKSRCLEGLMHKKPVEAQSPLIDRDVIDFSSNLQKHPYGHQVANMITVAKKDGNLLVPSIFRQVFIKMPL